jgi:hypothetical protein
MDFQEALMVNSTQFDWKRRSEAETFFQEALNTFLQNHETASQLEKSIKEKTSTKLIDWVDHIVIPDSESIRARLAEMGFTLEILGEAPPGRTAFYHPGAVFPKVVLQQGRSDNFILEMAIKVEAVADFAAKHDIKNPLEGAPWSRYRKVLAGEEGGLKLIAVERRVYRGYLCEDRLPEHYKEYLKAEELWRTRPRNFADPTEGFKKAMEIIETISARLGKGIAGHIFFEQERRYWQERNKAGRIQRERQDSLGLGWANHDHHTFRCSRKHLQDLVRFLECLGFHCRERFYAGQEAGWGAQVMENRLLGITVFADLDLAPEETEEDFAHKPLSLRKDLGTVGLWVALHGESFLEAGMHHLAVRADFDAMRRDMAEEGIQTMKPFSDFPFLRQAFTQGEQWKVKQNRLRELLHLGSINEEQYKKFSTEGAVGSHLENIERKEGFKGFNQRSVSAIIQATDPRAYSRA